MLPNQKNSLEDLSLSDAVLDFADAPKFHFSAGNDSS